MIALRTLPLAVTVMHDHSTHFAASLTDERFLKNAQYADPGAGKK